MIEDAASPAGIEPAWLAVTVWRESGCDYSARGSSGEIGLTQIHPTVWAKTLGTSPDGWEMWNPESNLRYSAAILRRLRDSSASEREMFRKYNGSGPKARKYAAKQVAVLAGL
jgi:soluble lytic murein transglycosylase-like protein